MADSPSDGPLGLCFSQNADDGAARWRLSVKNEQSCRQLQDEETQTKKTENGKISPLVVEGTEALTFPDPLNHNDPELKLKAFELAIDAALKGKRRGSSSCRNSMDYRDEKPSESMTHEGKKDVLASLNGVVTLNCGPLTNGYPGRPCTDNDGSGSESGYTTPKKRRAQRNGKSVDHVTPLSQGKGQNMQPSCKQDPVPAAPELLDRTSVLQVDFDQTSSRADSVPGDSFKTREVTSSTSGLPVSELYRRSSGKKFEEKSTKTKVANSAKEDSWTLFKQPPVFPVDNSSAKIVPKISYASKVKENLNKATQAGTETPSPVPQVPGRPSQVPMSAVKTITSASFSNGEGNICPLPGPHFSSVPSVPVSSAGTDHVASSSAASSGHATSSTSAPEPRKLNRFIYPHSTPTSSNMQLSLPSGRQSDPPSSAPNQKALGDIFLNQWGLSFINDPSGGSEGPLGSSAEKDKPGEVNFATQVLVTPQRPDKAVFPKAYDSEKRTSAQVACKDGPLVSSVGSGSTEGLNLELEAQKDEAGVSNAIVFCSLSKDGSSELPHKLSFTREQGYTKGFERRASWNVFDLKAAVVYHTKEMEYILNLQKQDPNRVVFYTESTNGPDQ